MTTSGEQFVPDWIRANSDVWASMQEGEGDEKGEEDKGGGAAADAVCAAQGLPVCGVDCADAALYYRVFTFWCVPLLTVLRFGHFGAAWFKLPQAKRADILNGGACATELGSSSMLEMVARMDEPELLSIVHFGGGFVSKNGGRAGGRDLRQIRFLMGYDAVRCVRAVHAKYVRNVASAVSAFNLAVMAAQQGALNVLKGEPFAVYRHSLPLRNAAIRLGHLHVLQWTHCHIDLPFTERDFLEAAEFGRWPIIEWMRDNAYIAEVGRVLVLQKAAMCGHLELVQRLRQDDWAPWGWHGYFLGNVCAIAARADHLDVARWAKENGCSWDQQFMDDQLTQFYHIKRVRDWVAAGGPTEKEEERAKRRKLLMLRRGEQKRAAEVHVTKSVWRAKK